MLCFRNSWTGSLGFLKSTNCRAPGGAVLAAGGRKSLGDAVVAEGALIDRLLLGMQVAAAVRAGLHAVAAAEAVTLVDQHDAIGADEGGADGADLDARGIDAVVAELGDEEALDVDAAWAAGSRPCAPLGESTLGCLSSSDLVALDPGAEVAVGDVVLLGAGLDAVAAADALADVDEHAPPVLGHLVGVGRGLGAGDLLEGGADGGEHQELGSEVDEVAAGDVHGGS